MFAKSANRKTSIEDIMPVLHQLHWLPVRRRVDCKISTLVCRTLASIAPVYLADECTLVTTTGRRPLRSADSLNAWSRDHATSLVTAVLSLPGQRCGTVCPNSFGNRTSPSGSSNDRWKRLCLVNWAVVPGVWRLRVLTENLLTYLSGASCSTIVSQGMLFNIYSTCRTSCSRHIKSYS